VLQWAKFRPLERELIVSDKEIVSTFEFRSIGDAQPVDVQIEEWLQQYPQVTVLDVKYQVVPYVENDTLNFASFALVLYHEPDIDDPEVNRAVTQRMHVPPHAAKRNG
jgi:hypothetical protein